MTKHTMHDFDLTYLALACFNLPKIPERRDEYELRNILR